MSSFTADNPYADSPYAENARNPRAIITLNGIRVKWYELSVTATTFYLADTFHFDFPLSGQDENLTLEYFANTENFLAQIYIGFPPDPDSYSTSDLDLIIQGNVDDLQIDLASRRVAMSGRDLSSNFLDNKTTQKFSNQTSSQIVQMFADQYDIKTRITPTNTLVGSYYAQQQVMLSSESTEWDLMVFLAQQEEFVLFMEGETLVFEPRPDSTNVTNPYVISYVAPTDDNGSPMISAVGLTLSRSMTLAADAQVTVRVPFGSKTGKAFNKVASSSHRKSNNLDNAPSPSKKVQKYSYSKPGLTEEQALQFAQQRLKEITSHEVRLSATLPGDNLLKKDSLIQLTGTNTPFDQYYYSDQVTRTIQMSETGYDMQISAKNHSVDTEVTPQES